MRGLQKKSREGIKRKGRTWERLQGWEEQRERRGTGKGTDLTF